MFDTVFVMEGAGEPRTERTGAASTRRPRVQPDGTAADGAPDVAERIAQAHRAAAALGQVDLERVAVQDLGELLTQLEQARAVFDAAANQVLDRFDAQGGAAYDGLRTTRSWLAQRCQMTGATAQRRVRTARALRQLPEVARGFRNGRFSADQVDLFARQFNDRTAEAMVEDESVLAGLADRLRPDEFARELRGWAEMVDTDGTEPDPGHRTRGFSFAQTLDDSWTGRLDLGSADGALLHAAIAAMAQRLRDQDARSAVDGDDLRADDAPGRTGERESGGRSGDADPGDPDAGGTGGVGRADSAGTTSAASRRSPAQLRADALVELVRRGVAPHLAAATAPLTGVSHDDQLQAGGGSDAAPTSGADASGPAAGAAPRAGSLHVKLHLVLDAADLASGRGADTFDGDHLSPADTDRLLCDCTIARILFDPTSGLVLDHARARRLITPAQRAALAVRDGGCSFPGCDVGPTACEGHHILHWRRGGNTDMANLTLVCWAHHALVHDDGWIIVPDARGGSPQWQRPDGTPVDPRPGWLHPDDARADDGAAAPGRAASRRALRLVAPPAPSERTSGAGPPDDDVRGLAELARARALALRAA
jgi:hypothetical protein